MPNISGLEPAKVLLGTLREGHPVPYGRHTQVIRTGQTVSIMALGGTVIATIDFSGPEPSAKGNVGRINPRNIGPVNVFLSPYGEVKKYWRTGEYRWHRADGAMVKAPSVAKPSVPEVVVPTVEVEPTREAARAAKVAAAVVKQAESTSVSISMVPGAHAVTTVFSEKTWTGKKQPVVRMNLTKTYSAIGEVLLPTTSARTLERAWNARQAGYERHVLVTGPAGVAKTRLAEQFAFTKGVPFLNVDGASIQTASDWYGSIVPRTDGSEGFEWVWSDFGKVLLRGTPCVVNIDELNRVENERALNGLMTLLAWTAVVHPNGAPQPLSLAPGILIMATLNEGPEFVGTVEVDAALRNRFTSGVRMDYTSEAIERRVLRQAVPGLDAEVARRLIRVAQTQRAKRDNDMEFPSHNVLSTRVLIGIAQDIVLSGEPQAEVAGEVIMAAASSSFIKEDERALLTLIEAQFGPAPEVIDDLAEDDDIERMLAAE